MTIEELLIVLKQSVDNNRETINILKEILARLPYSGGLGQAYIAPPLPCVPPSYPTYYPTATCGSQTEGSGWNSGVCVEGSVTDAISGPF